MSTLSSGSMPNENGAGPSSGPEPLRPPPPPAHPHPHPHPHHHHHHHPHLPLHHAGRRIVDTFDVLIRTRAAQSVSDLITMAQRGGYAEVIPVLLDHKDEPVPLDHVLHAVELHLEKEAYRARAELLQRLAGAGVGLLLPLPPHVAEQFAAVSRAVLLLPDAFHRHLPPHIHRLNLPRVEGVHACRHARGELEAVAFDSFRSRSGFQVEPHVMDVIDGIAGGGAPELLAHLRPHPHPGDLPLPADMVVTCI